MLADALQGKTAKATGSALQYAKTLHGAQTLQQYAQGNHLHKQATAGRQGQRVGQKAVRRS